MSEQSRHLKKLLQWKRMGMMAQHEALMRGLKWKLPWIVLLLALVVIESKWQPVGNALVRLFGGGQ